MVKLQHTSRREFLQLTALGGAGLVLVQERPQS
jgi:hypothetical protein